MIRQESKYNKDFIEIMYKEYKDNNLVIHKELYDINKTKFRIKYLDGEIISYEEYFKNGFLKKLLITIKRDWWEHGYKKSRFIHLDDNKKEVKFFHIHSNDSDNAEIKNMIRLISITKTINNPYYYEIIWYKDITPELCTHLCTCNEKKAKEYITQLYENDYLNFIRNEES